MATKLLLGDLWCTQRSLKRDYQIEALVAAIKDGQELPRISIRIGPDDEADIHNGHHRATAYFLAGRTWLEPEEYDYFFSDRPSRRFWRLKEALWMPAL